MTMLQRFFQLKERKSSIKIELLAGLTAFLTMAYIIVVNSQILSDAGMDKNALIIVTCLVTGISTIAVGLLADVPIAMAPGMGLNAFFAYSLVIGRGISWETALGIVFLSGLMFLILTITGARERMVKAIPESVLNSISVGIGLFIAFIGFRNLGLVVKSDATLVTLGDLKSWTLLAGLIGLIVIVVLEALKVKGGMLIGIGVATLLGFVLKHSGLDPNAIPQAEQAVSFSISPIFLKLDIIGALKWSFLGAIFTLMFADLFDSVGTIVACSYEAGLVEKDGSIKKLGTMLTLDAAATMGGALMGTSTTTSYIESAAGIEAGGKTGLTSVFNGIFFLLAIFLLPILTLVPSYAVAPALIIVGMYMMRRITQMDLSKVEEAFPAFITMITMPLTYSINYGMALGFISYVLIKTCMGKFKEVDWIMWIIAGLSVGNLLMTH